MKNRIKYWWWRIYRFKKHKVKLHFQSAWKFDLGEIIISMSIHKFPNEVSELFTGLNY